MKKFIYTLLAALFILPISLTFAACAKTYNINFMVDGRVYQAVQVKSDEPITRIADPEKEGYIFDGWYFSEADDAQKFNFEISQIGSDITLYAKWIRSDYAVLYRNMEGATNDPRNPSSYSTAIGSISLWPATKINYNFEGWYNNPEFNGERVTDIDRNSMNDITLYAKWSTVYFDITYNLNGGENNPDNPAKYTVEDTVHIAAPTYEHHDFAGWYTDQELQHGPINTITLGSSGNKTLYAKWTLHDYSITYNLAGGTQAAGNPAHYTFDDQNITLLAATKDYYDFSCWKNQNNQVVTTIAHGSSGDLTLTAEWTPQPYAIDYHLTQDAINPVANPATYTIESAEITLEQPTRTAYSFQGWYDNPEFNGTRVYTIAAGSHADINLYPKWRAFEYAITYNTNGGDNNPDNPSAFTVEDTVTLLPATRTGYIFMGWHKRQDLSDPAVETIPTGTHNSVVLYADWELAEFTITFNTNGGSAVSPIVVQYTTAISAPANPTKDYNDFAGWFTDNGTFENEYVFDTMPAEDITLYANWTPTPYTINYHLNTEAGEANNANNPATYTYISDTITLAAPTKVVSGVNYTFLGWYDNDEFTGNPVTTIATGSHVAVNLYAKWQLQASTKAELEAALTLAGETVYLTQDIVEAEPVQITGDATIIGNGNNLYARISGTGDILLKNIHTTNIEIASDGGFGGNLVFDGGLIRQVDNPGTRDEDSAFYSLRNPNASFTFKNMTVAANVTKGIKIGGSAKSVTIDNCIFDSSTLDVVQGGTNSDIQSLSLVDIQIYQGDPTDITIINSYFAYSPQGSTAVPDFVDASGYLTDSDTGAAIKLKVEKAMHFGTVTITGNTFVGNYRDILVGTAPYANQFQTAAASASNGRSAEGLQYNTIDGWIIEDNTTDITAQVAAQRGVAVLSYIGGPTPFNKYTTRVANVGQVVDGCGIWLINVAQKVADTWYYVENGILYNVTVSGGLAVLTPKGQDTTIANVGLVIGELSSNYYNHYANGDVLVMADNGITMTLGSANPTLTNNYFVEVGSLYDVSTISSIQINGTTWNAGDTFLLSIGKNAKIQAKAFITSTTGNITTLYLAAPILATEAVVDDSLVVNDTINLTLPAINNPQATINSWNSWEDTNVRGEYNHLISNGSGHFTYHMITGQEAAWFGDFQVNNQPVNAAIAMTKKDKHFANGNVVVEYGLTDLDLLGGTRGVALYPQWIADTDSQKQEKLANLHGLVYNYTMFLVSQYGEYLGQNTVHIHINTMFEMNEDLEDNLGVVIAGLVANVYNNYPNLGEQSLNELGINPTNYYVLLGTYQTEVEIVSFKLGEVTYGPTDNVVLSIGNNTKIKDLVFYTETKNGKTYLYVAAPIYATEAIDGFSFMINDELYCLGDGTAASLNGVTPASYGANDTLTQAEGNIYNFVAGGPSNQAGISFTGLSDQTAVCLTKKEYVDVDGNKMTTYGLTALEDDGTLLFYTYYSYDDKSVEDKAAYKAQYNGGHINYTFYAMTATGEVLGSAAFTFNLNLNNI